MRFVKHISDKIEKGRRLMKFLRFGSNDIQEQFEANPFGYDAKAPEGTRAVYARSGKKGVGALIGFINVNQLDSLSEGEVHLYSTNSDGSSEQAFILMKNDGTMQVNGDADYAIRYSDMKSAFNQFKNDFNSHTHTGNMGAPTSPPTVPTSADMSPSKVDTVQVP